MKLSEAILLGDGLKSADASEWITPDGACGCAFGGALLACGITGEDFAPIRSEMYLMGHENPLVSLADTCRVLAEKEMVRKLWPWITAHHLELISRMYYAVNNSESSLETLVKVVQGWEKRLAPESPLAEPVSYGTCEPAQPRLTVAGVGKLERCTQ